MVLYLRQTIMGNERHYSRLPNTQLNARMLLIARFLPKARRTCPSRNNVKLLINHEVLEVTFFKTKIDFIEVNFETELSETDLKIILTRRLSVRCQKKNETLEI